MQDCQEQVQAEPDSIEVSKRQTQEKALQAALHGPEATDAVSADWFNCVLDESGAFVIFPAWRGIAIGAVASGKVRRCAALFTCSVFHVHYCKRHCTADLDLLIVRGVQVATGGRGARRGGRRAVPAGTSIL